MELVCTATIGGKNERDKFVARVESLGLNPTVKNDQVEIHYVGYNKFLCEVVIDLFEEQRRHSIDYR